MRSGSLPLTIHENADRLKMHLFMTSILTVSGCKKSNHLENI